MEGDQLRYTHGIRATAFQSTPSAWRETDELVDDIIPIGISIHSLRMEGDVLSSL